MATENRKDHCSFCGKESENLTYGNYGAICPECAALLAKLNENNKSIPATKSFDEIPKPAEMKAFLDQYVIGQDEAKMRICVAVYNHYKRINSNHAIDDVEIEKSNVVMVGPTGTGKCVTGNTKVTVRNKHTGEVEQISIIDFIRKYLK